jgi:uncharacterized protein (TIGR02246 family)
MDSGKRLAGCAAIDRSEERHMSDADLQAGGRNLTCLMAAAWNQHDGEAYASLFTDDCDYIAYDGTWLRSREANARHHSKLFDSVLKGSRLVFEPEIRVVGLAPDIAIMHAFGSVLLPWQAEVSAGRRSIQTYVLVRAAAGWRIRSFHNARYRPRQLPGGILLGLIEAWMELRAQLAGRRRVKSSV